MADDDGADAPADGHTSARAILTVEQRVAHIVGMMERFEWVRGKSGPVLAEKWGLSLSVVEKASAEAHRRVTASKDDAERDITLGARKLFLEAVANGDAKAAKMMGDLWADVAGAKAPEKRELSGSVGVGEVSPATAAELVRKKFGGHAARPDPGETPGEGGGVPGSAPGT